MRILYLSDSPSGRDLVLGKLAEEGIACDLRCVETGAQFQTALGQGAYDLFLADYSLPSLEIYPVLAVTREKRLDVPFILLSETLGDELTVEALKAGATDIVQKQKPSRLVAAVRRAMRDAGAWRMRRWELEELRAERERLSLTLENLGEGVLTTDPDGNVTSVNRIAEALTDWAYEEAVGKPVARVFPLLDERTRKPCESPVERVLTTGGSGGLLTRATLAAKGGTERLIAYAGATIRDHTGQILGVVLTFHEEPERLAHGHELSIEKKLEALRAFAGGIANDCNEVITTLVGHITMAKLAVNSGDEPLRRLINEVEKASIQVKRLVWRLETFARGTKQVEPPTSIADLVLMGKERERERAEKKPSSADLILIGSERERKQDQRARAGDQVGHESSP